MSALDPFQVRSRWRVLLPLTAVLSVGLVLAQSALVSPVGAGSDAFALRATVLQDHARLLLAVARYERDTHALPSPSFDISDGSGSGLSDARLVPLAQQDGWRGPYLMPGLSRPTASSFWGLVGPDALGPIAAGAPAAWGRLHRGYGEIDDETAAYLDRVLDDGDPSAGTVQVTETWIWFRLAELSGNQPHTR